MLRKASLFCLLFLCFSFSNLHAQVLPPTLIVSNVLYNPAGQTTQINYGNGNITTYAYNNMQRLTQIKTINASNVSVQDLNYTYDAVGNILSITDNVNTADQTFQYDHLNRLTQAVGQNYGTKNYSYNAIGNITSKDGLTYTYDGIAGGKHAVTSLSDGTTFTYDANGNMATLQKGADLTQYYYDTENHLTQVKKNGAVVEDYVYDGDGGRTKKTPNSATPTTKFVGGMYDEQGTRKTEYILLGDQRVGSISNGNLLYYYGDHLGSANLVTNSTGVLKELSEYEPYGKFSRHEKYGTADEEAWHYFTNQYLDEATELYYYGARYYNPLIGRFITADTIIQSPGNPQTFNRYAYVGNNPVNRIDPTGHKWGNFWKSFIGAVVGVAAAIALGPIGLGWATSAWALGAIGGGVAGAVTGALQGGFRGALIGGITGGVLGGIGGWGVGQFGKGFGYAMFAAGGGYSASTGNLDSFVGGVVGGVTAIGVASYFFDGISLQMSEGQTDPYASKDWDILGIGTTDSKASAFANKTGAAVFYTRSRGYLSDFIRAGMQKVFRNSLASRQLAGYLKGADGFYIAAHSEGTLTLAGAIKVLSVDGVKLPNTQFDFNGPVIAQSTANNLASMVGAPQPKYNLNFGDPIGFFTTMNPIRASLYGIIGVSTLATYHNTGHYPDMH